VLHLRLWNRSGGIEDVFAKDYRCRDCSLDFKGFGYKVPCRAASLRIQEGEVALFEVLSGVIPMSEHLLEMAKAESGLKTARSRS